METIDKQTSEILVRGLQPRDLDAVVALDAKNVGRPRTEYFKLKLEQNLAETGVKISLAAELDGCFCGFLLARLYYGEFGAPEPVAVLDTFGVHPDFHRHGVGSALIGQLYTNLNGLGVSTVRTQVNWSERDLLAFFQNQGFRLADRLCLDLDLDKSKA
jgi:ribosomal protein S18 acetylase RimI-like enzyme